MKILLISSEPYQHMESPLLGVFQKDQYEALLAQGHEVGVISPAGRSLRHIKNIFAKIPPQKGQPNAQILKNTRFNIFPKFRYLEQRTFVRLGLRLFKRYVKKYGPPDVLHAHNAVWGGILARLISIETSIPYVITEHSSWVLKSSYHGAVRELMAHSYGAAHALITVSKSLAGKISADYGISNIEVVPNIIPKDFQNHAGSLKLSSIEYPRYIHVASLDDNKNQNLLLRSFKALLPTKPRARLVIIGDGPNRVSLIALAGELGIDHAVEFLGPMSRGQVAEQLAMSDIFLLTSLFETFGVVAIEAQAMGLPVVSTPCGGVSDIIEQGVNGQLSSGFDVESYVNEILEVDKLLVSLDKAKLRDDTLLKYGPQVIAKSLTRIYEAALSD